MTVEEVAYDQSIYKYLLIAGGYSDVYCEWRFGARKSTQLKKVSIKALFALNTPIILENCSTNFVPVKLLIVKIEMLGLFVMEIMIFQRLYIEVHELFMRLLFCKTG